MLKRLSKIIFFFVLFLGLIAALLFFVRFKLQWFNYYKMASISMSPNYKKDTIVFTSNLTGSPSYGDVIAFEVMTPYSDKKAVWVSRVIGMPGDKIQIINETVFLNKKPLTRKPYKANESYRSYNETLKNRSYIVKETQKRKTSDNTVVYEIPENSYFIMGDNRDSSFDSRFPEIGFIPKDSIVGKVFLGL